MNCPPVILLGKFFELETILKPINQITKLFKLKELFKLKKKRKSGMTPLDFSNTYLLSGA